MYLRDEFVMAGEVRAAVYAAVRPVGRQVGLEGLHRPRAAGHAAAGDVTHQCTASNTSRINRLAPDLP
ncbi:unnamed protein product [Danaus chrysippus]|uniref:(African queen) hypothetical protein n=1 Tax=Danaus chrysippus TaxID=151541 RepID=A0A8J2QI12_9NEOP|nr:unnamed protein product [Danaus chrysippus]